MGQRIRTVAIVGGGPAGSALAFYLARAGIRTVLFDRPVRPPLVVGESLVPATVPFLRDLGIEEDVRGYSTFKPGATFVMEGGEKVELRFAEACRRVPDYAYNVDRQRFDNTLLKACTRSGVHRIERAAELERVTEEHDSLAAEYDAKLSRLED